MCLIDYQTKNNPELLESVAKDSKFVRKKQLLMNSYIDMDKTISRTRC